MVLFFHLIQYHLVKHLTDIYLHIKHRKWCWDRACSSLRSGTHTFPSPDTTSGFSERIPRCLQASRLKWSWTSSTCVDALNNSVSNSALFNLRHTVQRSTHYTAFTSGSSWGRLSGSLWPFPDSCKVHQAPTYSRLSGPAILSNLLGYND